MKKKIFIIALITMLLPIMVFATEFEQITVSNSSIGFTSTKIFSSNTGYAKSASCVIETDQIRFTSDGQTTPTSSVGVLAYPGDQITVTNVDAVKNFRAIRVTTDAQLDCEYFFQ